MGLVLSRLPSSAGSEWFDMELCEGMLGRPGFDPAPQLPFWMLASVGCTDSRLVSRGSRPAKSGSEKLLTGAHRLTCWTRWELGMEPGPGDVLLVGDRRRGETLHSCVYLGRSGAGWEVAEVHTCQRTGALTASVNVKAVSGTALAGARESRSILGWVDLDRVPLL